jgi:hypothetical protein
MDGAAQSVPMISQKTAHDCMGDTTSSTLGTKFFDVQTRLRRQRCHSFSSCLPNPAFQIRIAIAPALDDICGH